MTDQQHPIDEYILLCERIYHRLIAAGQWPPADSPNPENLVESVSNPQVV